MKPSSLIALALFSLVSTRMAAADQKRMPANACLLEYDSETNYDRGSVRIGAFNGAVVDFVCPLIRSNTTNTNGLSSLVVNLFKGRPTTFQCDAESYDNNGSLLKRVTRSTSQTGITSLNFGTSLNSGGAQGTYGLWCQVTGSIPSIEWGDEMFDIYYDEP